MTGTTRKLYAPAVRFSHSLAFIDSLHSIGTPVERYLQNSKLPTLCDDPDCLIPVTRMYSFLEESARREDLLIGWSVGESAGDKQFSTTLRDRLEHAPTLLVALENLVKSINSESSDIDVRIVERTHDFILLTRYPGMREAPGYAIAQSYQISVFISLVRMFLGKDWCPNELGMELQRSLHELPEQFHACKFKPQSPFGYFTIEKAYLHQSLTKGPSAINPTSGLSSIGELSELELMSKLLRSYLPTRYPSQALAAEILGISARSLTRRMAEHGTTYQKFIDGLRFQIAKGILENPDARVLDAANAVGFEDQADFTRMFRRISGLTPTEFRKTACMQVETR